VTAVSTEGRVFVAQLTRDASALDSFLSLDATNGQKSPRGSLTVVRFTSRFRHLWYWYFWVRLSKK
jgi:hypothetical protein